MSGQNKAQTIWSIVLAALALAATWAWAPPIQISIGREALVLLDKPLLSCVALIVALLLAAAIGGPTDANSGSVRTAGELRRYQIAINRLRLAVYLFFAVLAVLLVIELSHQSAPLTWIEHWLASIVPGAGLDLVVILFSTVCGLAMTFLLIDSYVQPLAERFTATQSQSISATRLREEVTQGTIEFFEVVRSVLSQNAQVLQGAKGIDQTLQRFVLRFNTSLVASKLLGLADKTEQTIADAIASLADCSYQIKEALRFLTEYNPSDNRAGVRLFKRNSLDGIVEDSLDKALAALAEIHRAINLVPQPYETLRLSNLANEIVDAWEQVLGAAAKHYGVELQPVN